MPVIFQHRVHRNDLRANPGALYVFGDNERRVGYGGQAAEMRGEPNAMGVATLQAPGRYWTDADAERQCTVIDADLKPIADALARDTLVVFPIDGIGTGLANLASYSPTTFAHLQARLAELGLVGNAA